MATYSQRTRTKVYQEVALEWPTNVTELEKAIAAARGWLQPGTERDDTFTVTHDDEELIIRWVSHTRLDAPQEASDGYHTDG
jgi:predicted phosphohydrolase